ncbi:MAG: ArnT family glycosyltransferase [Nannocystales bacterium]
MSRILVGVSIVVISVVLLVMVLRIGFPLELEWMEGGVLHQAQRFAHGEALYPPPGRDFVPFLYTPGFAVLLGSLGKVFGVSYTLGRLISIVSCVAIGWAIWRAVELAGKPRAHRIAAVALFASGYVFTFRWLDLARPDTLAMALCVWALVVLRDARGSHRKAIFAGVLMALSFWTKQTAATFVIASGVGALLVAPRQLPAYALSIAVIDGGGVLVGNALTEGRLWHYIYELHQSHAFNDERFEKKTWGMFLHAGPFVLLAASVSLGAWLNRLRTSSERWVEAAEPAYWGLMAFTGLLVSALGYSTQWAEPNAFIPGVLMGSIAVGVLLPTSGRLSLVGKGLVGLQLCFALAVEPMYQPIQNKGFAGLERSYAWQSWARTVPSDERRARADTLRKELEAGPGPVLALQRPWWTVLAGGEGHVGSMGITDVLPEDRAAIEKALVGELRDGQFAQVWTEGDPPRWMMRGLSGYSLGRRLHGAQRVRPMSGYMSDAGMVTRYRADQLQFVPAGPRPLPEGTVVVADFESGRADGFTARGRAFGRRATRSVNSSFPAVGPTGGRYYYSSAGLRGDLKATGSSRSAPFVLPRDGSVELLLGAVGKHDRLAVALVGGEDRVPLAIPPTHLSMAPVRWNVPPEWADREVVLELRDDAKNAALFVDDVRLLPTSLP